MKLTIPTLLLALLAATEVTAASNRDICLTKNRNVVEAVNAFCNSKRNIVVPSAYAKAGGTAATKNGPRAIKVSIGGNCKPPQWVPQKYCKSQFMGMCARSAKGSYGASAKRFGRNKCQNWSIQTGYVAGRQ
ncbi:hypothetical protein D0863_05745 [Hortaea werneckii]|uniref:Uncharacterized protein n=1 Tax=Hortaea werneckii TaxID=91943 RepID=A0A3M7E1Q4_HORWE|nr:hypothetical protein D0863_05745 [Hortaea werneckii]